MAGDLGISLYRNKNSEDTLNISFGGATLPEPSVADANFTNPGYNFKYWSTSRTDASSGTRYEAGTVTSQIPYGTKLYAIWEADYIDSIKTSDNIEHPIKDTISGYITSADENVFVAIYGTTTASEVQAALSAGKLVVAMKSDGQSIALLCGIASTVYSFSYSAPNATANVGYPSFSVWTLNRNTNSWNTVHTTQVAKRENTDLTGTPTAPTAASGTNTTQIATTAFVQTAISGKIDDPSTKTSGQFLKYNGTTWVAGDVPEGSAASSTTPKMDGTASTGSENAFARGDHIHPTDTSRQAKITASGILKGNGSGTVTAATAGTDYQAPLTFDGTYNASTNKAATVSTVTNAINALDGGTIGTGSTTKTITSLSQSNGNVSATFSDIAFPVTSVNGQTGAVTTAEKFVITATAISGTEYYNLDKTFADIVSAIGDNKYVTIGDIDATYPYTTITTQGIVFGATLLATSNGKLMAVTDGILVFPPDSGTNAMGIAVHSTNLLPTMGDIPSASSTTPSMDGTADVGIQTTYARADHVHPTDTSRQAVLVSGTNIKTINNTSLLGSGNIDILGALNSTSKLYLVGAENQQSSVTSYSNSNVYATNGVLNAKSFSVDASANIVYNSSSKSIDFTFV